MQSASVLANGTFLQARTCSGALPGRHSVIWASWCVCVQAFPMVWAALIQESASSRSAKHSKEKGLTEMRPLRFY